MRIKCMLNNHDFIEKEHVITKKHSVLITYCKHCKKLRSVYTFKP